MTRKQIIDKALANKEIELDVAGGILLEGDKEIKKALEKKWISLDLAGQLLSVNEEN